MKLLLLAGIALATYAAPITATMTCRGSFGEGESTLAVSGAVYGQLTANAGCGLVLDLYGPNTMYMIAASLGGPDGSGTLNGYRIEGSGPGTITRLRAIFDLDPSGYASGYFSVLRMAPEWFRYIEVLHVDAFGTYSISEEFVTYLTPDGWASYRTSRTVSLTLDTDPNAVQTPEPSAVVGTTLGLGVLLLNRDRLRFARRQHRITG